MQESPSFSSFPPHETAATDTFRVDAAAEFRKRNAFQAALMGYWLAANPDQDEVAWVALFAEPFAGFYARLGDELPQDAATNQDTVKTWMEMLEGS